MLIPNRTLYTNKKVLDLSKSILFSFIGNDCIMYYPPFLVAVAIIKFSKDNLSITKKEPYDKYFNKERINEIYAFIKKEYKLTKEIDDDNKNWDLKTMSSTVEEIKEIKEVKDGIAPFIRSDKLLGYVINRNPGSFSSYGKYGYSRYGHYGKYKRYISMDESSLNTEDSL